MTTNKRLLPQQGRVEHVRLGAMRYPPHAQRELREAWVNKILSEFDLDAIGIPVLSERRGVFYVLDGQHRIEALKRFLEKDWEDSRILCNVFRGLTEVQEAQKFDELNNNKTVNSFCRFRIRVAGEREVETAVQRVVESCNLRVSRDDIPGSIQAVSTLCRVYKRSDAEILGKSLRIISTGFGDAGFTAPIIDATGLFVQRYNGAVNERVAANALQEVRGGVSGVMNQATALHERVGGTKSHAIAATIVDIVNRGLPRNKKLPSWWKETDAT